MRFNEFLTEDFATKQMAESGDKYLVPNVYTMEYIKKVVSVWYMG